jgi:hypothetical protein
MKKVIVKLFVSIIAISGVYDVFAQYKLNEDSK